jgi:chaperonin GroES
LSDAARQISDVPRRSVPGISNRTLTLLLHTSYGTWAIIITVVVGKVARRSFPITCATKVEMVTVATKSKASGKGDETVAKIRPVGDRVVVKPSAKEEVSKGGIIIPDTAKEKPQEGTVMAVGGGKLLDNGERSTMELKVGDKVLFAKYGGTEFKFDGEDLLVLRESDVLAVLAE